MPFTSWTFLGFLAATVAVASFAATVSGRRVGTAVDGSAGNGVLAAASVWFVLAGGGRVALALVVSALLTHLAARGIVRARETARVGTRAEALLTVGVAGHLLLLLACRYAWPIAADPSVTRSAALLAVPALVVPFGLLFYVLHAISLLVDTYRGETTVGRSPVGTVAFLLAFPFLVAGPVLRYRAVDPQLRARRVGMAAFALGVRRFAVGLAKTWLIAAPLSGPALEAFARPAGALSVVDAWVGVTCFGLQIYFALSGYADMALGVGRMLGFRLPENFRWPYAAESLTDFWRRWYISLTVWLRTYLAAPPVLLMVLVGVWHGPEWSYLRWGLFHGSVLWAEGAGVGRWMARRPRAVRHLYVVSVLTLGWVIFRSPTWWQTRGYLAAMLDAGDGPSSALTLTVDPVVWVALIVAVPASLPLMPSVSRWAVTVDALTTSGLMLVAAPALLVWRTLRRLAVAIGQGIGRVASGRPSPTGGGEGAEGQRTQRLREEQSGPRPARHGLPPERSSQELTRDVRDERRPPVDTDDEQETP